MLTSANDGYVYNTFYLEDTKTPTIAWKAIRRDGRWNFQVIKSNFEHTNISLHRSTTMFSSTSLLAAVMLALSVAASPVPHSTGSNSATDSILPINIHFNLSGTTIPKLDHLRAANLVQRAHSMRDGPHNSTSADPKGKRAASFNIANSGVSYVANVGVGTPPTSYTLVLDTGSSNTWVGAGKKYVQTSSSKNTGNSVAVSYGSGQMSGHECAYFAIKLFDVYTD